MPESRLASGRTWRAPTQPKTGDLLSDVRKASFRQRGGASGKSVHGSFVGREVASRHKPVDPIRHPDGSHRSVALMRLAALVFGALVLLGTGSAAMALQAGESMIVAVDETSSIATTSRAVAGKEERRTPTRKTLPAPVAEERLVQPPQRDDAASALRPGLRGQRGPPDVTHR